MNLQGLGVGLACIAIGCAFLAGGYFASATYRRVHGEYEALLEQMRRTFGYAHDDDYEDWEAEDDEGRYLLRQWRKKIQELRDSQGLGCTLCALAAASFLGGGVVVVVAALLKALIKFLF